MSKNYGEIGALLRRERENLGVNIVNAAQILHIRTHYLQALENGELEKLPSSAYAKGYIQSYASFLNLDKDEIIRRFEQVKHTLPERGYFFPQVFNSEKKPTNAIVWGGIIAVVLLYIMWGMFTKPTSLPEFSVEPPPTVENVGNRAN